MPAPTLPTPDAPALHDMAVTAQPLPEIFTMGGYGMYVWPCYGLLLVMLMVMAYLFRRDRRYAYQGLKLEREYREARRAERSRT